MNTALPTIVNEVPCWHRIGVWGDQSCPELLTVTHCHNCPVFATAGRKFLDAPSPADYLEEWTARLAVPERDEAADVTGVLVFRLADEWLGFPVSVLVEVTHLRPTHRIPHRGGLLAGVVNIRGELHLCARLDLLLGITKPAQTQEPNPRLVLIRQNGDGWAFAADEVDQVHRIPRRELHTPAPTLSRAVARVTRAVFTLGNRSIGLLDDERVFQFLAERVR